MNNVIYLFVILLSTTLNGQEMKPLKPIRDFTFQPDYKIYNKLGINKPMPAIEGIALNDISIDSLYFKNKVTILCFSYLGCPPCMFEIKYLNQLQEKYKDQRVNVLSVFSINRQGLCDFLNKSDAIYKHMHESVQLDTLTYTLMPECLGEDEDYRGKKFLGPQCNRISKYYGVDRYPLTIIIDKNRIVRHISRGFTVNNDKAALIKNNWINIIDDLLSQ